MRRIVYAAAATCASLSAQAPTDVFEKAPPQVEEALRGRIGQFYQAHIDGKFRAAEELVAADSRDLFYESPHQRYLSYEIAKIEYTDNFTKAKVVTALELDWRTPRMGTIRVKPPLASTWKFENGVWFWYTLPKKDWVTPWGVMKPGPDSKGPNTAMEAAFKGVTPDQVQARFRLSKNSVVLSSFEKSHDVIEVQSALPGEVSLHLDGISLPGLTMTLDKATLKDGETGHVVFDYVPPSVNPKEAVKVMLRVDPLGQTHPIQITFAVPAEAQQQLKRAR